MHCVNAGIPGAIFVLYFRKMSPRGRALGVTVGRESWHLHLISYNCVRNLQQSQLKLQREKTKQRFKVALVPRGQHESESLVRKNSCVTLDTGEARCTRSLKSPGAQTDEPLREASGHQPRGGSPSPEGHLGVLPENTRAPPPPAAPSEKDWREVGSP